MIYSYRGYFKIPKSLISELYIYWDMTFVDGGGGECKKAGGYTCDVGKKKRETHNSSGLGKHRRRINVLKNR